MPRKLPVGVGEAEIDELMYRDLFGIGLMRFRKLERQGLISGECHRLVVAALLVRLRKTAAQAQALLGDHLYVIGPSASPIVKIGRSVNVDARLSQLAAGSPVRLVIRHVEPGFGSAEAALHKIFDYRRIHGEWFDFADTDPVAEVRGALPSIEALAWLHGLATACEETAAEMSAAGRPVRAQELLRAALKTDHDRSKAEAEAALIEDERHARAIAAGRYAERHEEAAQAVWRALKRPPGADPHQADPPGTTPDPGTP